MKQQLKIGFIQARNEIDVNWFRPLAFGYLKSYIDKYSNVSVDMRFLEKLENLEDFNIIAISSTSQDFAAAKEIAQTVKNNKKEVVTVLGGHHITYIPQTLSEEFDVGVLGEGEQTFLELICHLANNFPNFKTESLKNIRGLCFYKNGDLVITSPRELIYPPDSIPIPYRAKGETPYLFSSRGCPYRCAFCSSSAFWKKTRFFSAKYVVDEIESLLSQSADLKHIAIWDDLFVADVKRLNEIVNFIEQRGINQKISFDLAVRANLVNDELCRLLKRMNVIAVGFGAESGSNRILKLLNKGVTVERNQNAIDTLNRYGILVGCSFIVGCPTETEAEVRSTYEFILKNVREGKLSPTGAVNILMPMPGTEIWSNAVKSGLIDIDNIDWNRLAVWASYRNSNINNFKKWVQLRQKNNTIYLAEDTLPQTRLYEIMYEHEEIIKNLEKNRILPLENTFIVSRKTWDKILPAGTIRRKAAKAIYQLFFDWNLFKHNIRRHYFAWRKKDTSLQTHLQEKTENKQVYPFPESALVHKYCVGKGLEIGGSAHNPFGLNTLNVDFTDSMDTMFKKEEIHLCGKALKVDIVAPGDDIPLPDDSLNPKMETRIAHFLVLVRAIWWSFVGPQRRKFAKVWATYKFGGIRLCWCRAIERFGRQKCKYDYKENQLSQVQSNYIISRCSIKPFFSIIVPVYKVERRWLEKCIRSVVSQHYTDWELILVDDGSQKDDLKQLMDTWASRDNRIHAYYLEKNRGIAGATNFGIKQARGEFVGFLDHDDELTPDALTWVVWTLNKYPNTLWLYSDEDLISHRGKCHSPRFKPDFSPEFLLSNMFTCHFSVYSADILNKVGGVRLGFDGSQDHDLALRLSEIIPREKIVHIPRVLYHWRKIPSSAAAGIGAKPKAPLAGRKAVAEALERRNIKAKVTSYELCPTIYQITFQLTSFPRISIIIPTKNSLHLLKKCLNSIRSHTNYPSYGIVVIDNQSDDKIFLEFIAEEQLKGLIKVIKYNKPFNHSDMNNIAVKSVDSDLVVFMNNDIEIISDNWLEQLVAIIQMDESIAGVGALLLYPNGTVQHGGIIWGLNGTAGHAHKYVHSGLPGYFGRLHTLQEMSGITAALALIRRSSFEQVGGFDSNRYPTLYNDVDLCIRLRKNGYRCIYNPMVRAIHYETKTRPIDSEELVYKKNLANDYAEILNRDPFYNPNLALDNEQFRGFRAFPVEEQIPELRAIQELSAEKECHCLA